MCKCFRSSRWTSHTWVVRSLRNSEVEQKPDYCVALCFCWVWDTVLSSFFFFLTWIMVWWWLIADSEPSALCDWNWSTCQSPSLSCGDSCWIKHTDKVGKKQFGKQGEMWERDQISPRTSVSASGLPHKPQLWLVWLLKLVLVDTHLEKNSTLSMSLHYIVLTGLFIFLL